ncbi:MAG: DUF167 domain-containing protein [Candidatus Nanohaloarchaea archaeon]
MSAWVTGQPNTITMTQIYVKVRPGSKEFRIETGHIPTLYLESEAENGKANAELVSRIKEIVGEKPAIMSGHKSRRKKLKIDMSEGEFRRKLEEAK